MKSEISTTARQQRQLDSASIPLHQPAPRYQLGALGNRDPQPTPIRVHRQQLQARREKMKDSPPSSVLLFLFFFVRPVLRPGGGVPRPEACHLLPQLPPHSTIIAALRVPKSPRNRAPPRDTRQAERDLVTWSSKWRSHFEGKWRGRYLPRRDISDSSTAPAPHYTSRHRATSWGAM